jgi:hypothetical protein
MGQLNIFSYFENIPMLHLKLSITNLPTIQKNFFIEHLKQIKYHSIWGLDNLINPTSDELDIFLLRIIEIDENNINLQI